MIKNNRSGKWVLSINLMRSTWMVRSEKTPHRFWWRCGGASCSFHGLLLDIWSSTTTLENHLAFSRRVKHVLLPPCNYSTRRYSVNRNSKHMVTAALLIIAKTGEQPNGHWQGNVERNFSISIQWTIIQQ